MAVFLRQGIRMFRKPESPHDLQIHSLLRRLLAPPEASPGVGAQCWRKLKHWW